MNMIPQRASLVNEVTTILRKSLRAGVWGDFLPGERALSTQIRISRQTLRAALEQLRREGLIKVAPGRRRRILLQPHAPKRRAPSKQVVMLSPFPLDALRPSVIFLVDELREHLAEAGFHLELHVSNRYYSRHPFKALESLLHQKPTASWILYLATLQMQRWFLDRGLPVLVVGSSYPEIALPSVDIDYRAACRHAVGTFLGKGHRQIAFLIDNTGRAGDQESKIGFLETIQKLEGDRPQTIVAEHNGTLRGICSKLDSLMRAPTPPSAFLVANSTHVLTVIGHLLRLGVRLAEDVVLISRDDDSFLEYIVPTVARYSHPPALFARKMSRIAVQLARGASVPPKRLLLVPQLIKGDTLGLVAFEDRLSCNLRVASRP